MAFEMWQADYFHNIRHDSQHRKFQGSSFILDEKIASVPFCLSMPSYAHYTPKFIEKIDQMIASGLTEKWYNEAFKINKNARKFVEEVEPRVLSVELLRFGFWAYAICMILSVFVFFTELFVYHSGRVFL